MAGDDRYGTIVGVVSDLKYSEIDVDTKPELFFHHADASSLRVMLMVRLTAIHSGAAPAIRKALSSDRSDAVVL